MNELPADVQDALRTKAGKGKIVKIESISRRDKLVAYEAEISRNGDRSEIQVDPHGSRCFTEASLSADRSAHSHRHPLAVSSAFPLPRNARQLRRE